MYVRKIKLGDDILLIPESVYYEEGNWTPRISLTSDGSSQITPQYFDGKYKRIGNEVHIKAYLFYQEIGTSPTIYLNGIPFSPIFPYSLMGQILVGNAIINDVTAKSVSAGRGNLVIKLPSETSELNISIDLIYWI